MPPHSVPKPTQFSFDLLLKTTSMPALPGSDNDNHFLLSPILSLSPHDTKFHQRVSIRFPFAAVPKGWFLRLLCCPSGGDRWEAIVDVLVPHSMSASSLVIMSCNRSIYDPDTNMISVDQFCYKCWVGVPLRHNVKKRVWCTLFGRPLGPRGKWEVIVRCFEPVMEVYHQIAERMQSFGAEPLIDDPEPLEIGKRGVVHVALEIDHLPWQLDVGCQEEFRVCARSTFWEGSAESILGYKCKFVVKPEEETDYVHVVASVSYIDDKKKQSPSILLDGTAPICGSSPRHTPSCVLHSSTFNIANCNDLAVGSDNQFIDKRTIARSLHQSYTVADTAIPDKMNEDCDSRGVVSRSANVITTNRRTEKCCQVVPECGQHV